VERPRREKKVKKETSQAFCLIDGGEAPKRITKKSKLVKAGMEPVSYIGSNSSQTVIL